MMAQPSHWISRPEGVHWCKQQPTKGLEIPQDSVASNIFTSPLYQMDLVLSRICRDPWGKRPIPFKREENHCIRRKTRGKDATNLMKTKKPNNKFLCGETAVRFCNVMVKYGLGERIN